MLKQTPKEEMLGLLKQKYSSVEPAVLEDLATAKIILMDTGYGDLVMTQLQKSLDASTSTLDLFLIAEETKRGFDKRQEVESILSRDDFMQILHNGHHILDLGAGPKHGPFSHRLQWFILYHAFDEQKLTLEPLALYKKLGESAFKDPQNPVRSIWDEIFDFDDDTPRFDVPTKQDAEARAGYSSAETLLSRLCGQAIPAGSLVRELRLSRLRYETFGRIGITDPKQAFLQGCEMKYASQLNFSDPDFEEKVKQYRGQLADKSSEELEKIYCTFNSVYAQSLQNIVS